MTPYAPLPVQATLSLPDARRVRRAVERLKRLPASLPILREALKLVEDPLCSFQELDRVLSVDQALTAQLLRLSNSAFYSVQSPVTTISRAITVVGLAKLHALMLQMFLAGLFHRMVGREPLGDQIWEDSVAAAAACKSVGEFFPDLDSDELLVGGLLHNIGEFVLLSQFREDYERAIALTDNMTHYGAQGEVFGVDSRQVGRWLLEAWRIPSILAVAAEHWEAPRQPFLDSHDMMFMNLIHVGIGLGRAWARRFPFDAAISSIQSHALGELSLDEQTLQEIYDNLSEPNAKVCSIRDAVCSAA